MLKALELSGFKSFADRTRFEFPVGISVVVGPNGSGKSNLVDAVKWILGSQSPKSLRGKEMTDVIFNGCATRPAMGTGEATLVLDNHDGRLAIDTKEVHVTRRVYRSGEGEYLLNRQPCRLRDIRDLLAGTGITTEAYCIIEQGKVDALLLSSPRDRRVIFEEAAGISQFKSKKAAVLRRMERVEQNLLRLSDIVDEVESRLRSIRAQAGKARRYRECSERLKKLRTELGLLDWKSFTKQIAAREAQLIDLRRRRDEHHTALDAIERELLDLESQIEVSIARSREMESAAATTREQIAAREVSIENLSARCAELRQELDRNRMQLTTMTSTGDQTGDRFHVAATQLTSAEADLAGAIIERDRCVEQANELQRVLQAAKDDYATLELESVELSRSLARHEHRRAALESQLAAVQTRHQSLEQLANELSQRRSALSLEVQRHEQGEAELRDQANTHQALLRTAESRLTQVRAELARADKQHRSIESAITRVRERISVLSDLEQRLEGIDGGVQKVLELAHSGITGPYGDVRGVVADLFHVDLDSAPLLEMALGERAQFVVVASAEPLFDSLERKAFASGGRVGFLRLDVKPPATVVDHVDLSGEAGVMGRADRFVEAAAEYAPLAKRLLGRTWLVDRLATALRLSQSSGRGLDFVTSDGELLTADGTLIVGPRLAPAGIISRRSELRACEEQVNQLHQQLAQHASILARLDEQRLHHEQVLASSVTSYSEFAHQLADACRQTGELRARYERAVHELTEAEGALEQVASQMIDCSTEIESIDQEQSVSKERAAQLESHLQSARENVDALETQLCDQRAAATERQLVAAKCEERVEMLHQQIDLVKRGERQRENALADARARVAEFEAQLVESEQQVLLGRQELAELYLCKESHAEALAVEVARDGELRTQKAALTDRIRNERQQLAGIQSQCHKLDVAINRLSHERETLCERLQDDYGIDLAAASMEQVAPGADQVTAVAGSLHTPSSPLPAFNRDAAEAEIAQLRDHINGIGAVNLEALNELDEMQARFERISGQYRDLVEAKASLERIMQRINVDSRQLFLNALETVRGHFQELFRRLFGGGEADIVVDEAEDILECGIEIVARPPGKEACSISLLSGGEKTLTCVALLLAVFRSKPSPFCVLDEVDAALDEANIGRFIGVLREFLSFTQFIVVTHSKKTMAGADTLYGVTMEESGVSKRVSVRFEDVSEDGHISPAALRRAA
jgi:chromosome segregation protein